jgi:protein tyrosine/serine phosphatase
MKYKKSVLSLLLSVSTFLPGAFLAKSSTKELTPANAHKRKVIEDLPNFHEVHPFLYRSGEPTRAGLSKLKEMGFSTLIDLRAPSEQKFDEKKAASELGLKYIRLVMTSAAPTKEQVDTTLAEIKKAQTDPTNGKVLVHCAHGSDRTGCMIGIWRVTQENWNYDDTYKEMRKYWFTPKFVKLSGAVKEYSKQN